VDEIRAMAILAHHHVASKHPADGFPDPVSAIKFRMEQLGLAPKDLIPYIGSQAAVSRVLNRKRSLTIQMIRRLRRHLEIRADDLIQPIRHWGKKKAA
jgi:HTH-type transcriptional regulator/antitoxin HigA